ncbi:MAG: hypothetical protein KAT43_01900 [Nanoarchaeota archaeon]|nr:hypothetical protein [Nanoarchaeota archaeon]
MRNRKGQTTWISQEYILVVLAVVGLFILMTFGIRVCSTIEQSETKGSFESFMDVYEGINILTSQNLTKCGVAVAFQDNEALVGFSAAQARVSPKIGTLRSLTRWISDTRINRPEAEYCPPAVSCLVLCNVESTPNADDCRGTLRLDSREFFNVSVIKRRDGNARDMVYFGDEKAEVEYLTLEKIGTVPYTIHIYKGDAQIKPCQSAVKIAERKFGEKPKFETPTIEEIDLS